MATATTKRSTNREVGDFTIEEIEEVRLNVPSKPLFPIIILSVAILKDLADIASVGFLGWAFTIIFGFVLWIWMTTKSGFIYRILWKWFLRRYVFFALVGIIPGLNFLPEATILVLLIYHKENKIIKALYKRLEQLRIVV